jgi:hypothetical protein
MSSSNFQWQGADEMIRRLQEYQNRIQWAVKQVALYWSAVFEEYAKREAKWVDRTGNARQSLHAYVVELSQDSVRLFLSHGVQYGLFLEVRWAGRLGIIYPTIQRHLPAIQQMLQGIFR